VAYVGYVPNVLAVHPSIPAKSVKELVALLKANPGKYNYASSGNGSTQHLAGELFKQLTGTSIVHVPYKGSGDAIKDLLAGVVAMNFDTMPPVLPHIQAGKLRGLAISTPKRLGQLQEVPTFVEEGITGFDVANWYGVMAPAGTSRDIVARLNADINKAMQVPEVRQRLESVGTQLNEQSAAQFESYMRAEVAKYAKLLKEIGVKVE
jgi:tripartite-type tricarboxylate transporter receptor subunit TctC